MGTNHRAWLQFALGAEIGIQLHLLPKGSYWARVGKACGEIIVGTGQIIFGCAGMTSGAGMSATGGGAVVGVPIIAGSVAIAANGCLTASHGLAEAQQLWREGDTSTNGTSASPEPAPPKLVPKMVAKQPITPAPVAKAAPAVKPAPPKPKVAAETQTTTRNKATGKTVTKKASGTRTTTQPKGTPAPLEPYKQGGGHHVPAKRAFEGAPGYDPKKALAIPKAELDKLKIKHIEELTPAQMKRYKAFAKTGQPLTWEAIAKIETDALVDAGMTLDMAKTTVAKSIQWLKDKGVASPVRIPWGK